MSNDVVLRSGKTLRVGDVDWIISEDVPVPLSVPDLIVDTRLINQNIHIAFATTRVEGGVPEASICARLRIDLGTAQNLRNLLDNMIADALKPADKTKAN